MIEIPPTHLSDDVLTRLIEEFVTRDGTDLADAPAKIARVRGLLVTGRAVILYDEDAESTSIVPREDLTRRRPPPAMPDSDDQPER